MKTKSLKKLVALLLSVIMMLGTVNVFAADPEYTPDPAVLTAYNEKLAELEGMLSSDDYTPAEKTEIQNAIDALKESLEDAEDDFGEKLNGGDEARKAVLKDAVTTAINGAVSKLKVDGWDPINGGTILGTIVPTVDLSSLIDSISETIYDTGVINVDAIASGLNTSIGTIIDNLSINGFTKGLLKSGASSLINSTVKPALNSSFGEVISNLNTAISDNAAAAKLSADGVISKAVDAAEKTINNLQMVPTAELEAKTAELEKYGNALSLLSPVVGQLPEPLKTGLSSILGLIPAATSEAKAAIAHPTSKAVTDALAKVNGILKAINLALPVGSDQRKLVDSLVNIVDLADGIENQTVSEALETSKEILAEVEKILDNKLVKDAANALVPVIKDAAEDALNDVLDRVEARIKAELPAAAQAIANELVKELRKEVNSFINDNMSTIKDVVDTVKKIIDYAEAAQKLIEKLKALDYEALGNAALTKLLDEVKKVLEDNNVKDKVQAILGIIEQLKNYDYEGKAKELAAKLIKEAKEFNDLAFKDPDYVGFTVGELNEHGLAINNNNVTALTDKITKWLNDNGVKTTANFEFKYWSAIPAEFDLTKANNTTATLKGMAAPGYQQVKVYYDFPLSAKVAFKKYFDETLDSGLAMNLATQYIHVYTFEETTLTNDVHGTDPVSLVIGTDYSTDFKNIFNTGGFDYGFDYILKDPSGATVDSGSGKTLPSYTFDTKGTYTLEVTPYVNHENNASKKVSGIATVFEIVVEDKEVPSLNPTSYSYIVGTAAAKTFVATSLTDNANYYAFDSITGLTNGNQYTISGNNITFTAAFLNSLAVGSYHYTVNFVGTTITRTITITVLAVGSYNGGGSRGGSSSSTVVVTTPTNPASVTVFVPPFIGGYEDGTVRPQNSLTRAELAQIIYNLYADGEKDLVADYTDVTSAHWAFNAIAFCQENSYMIGYPDGSFKPSQAVTRAELSAAFAKLHNMTSATGTAFADTSGHWAEGFINAMFNANVVTGYPDKTFLPNNKITRAEAVTIICKAEGRETDKYETTKLFGDLSSGFWAYNYMMNAANGYHK